MKLTCWAAEPPLKTQREPKGCLKYPKVENDASLYGTDRPQNRPKIGKKGTKNWILALFGLFLVTFKMIENWGSVGGRRVLNPKDFSY